jgi:bifunctional UDP-N-acetylglucosamine pyrophosphorylase / glucosamine-1-phosphate N-acetyltransferase
VTVPSLPPHQIQPPDGLPDAVAAVVVLAAGGGTRMRSDRPKVLHEIGGRSLLGHVLAAVGGVTPDEVVVVVGHGRDQVADHARQCLPSARTVVQDQQLGTGHATAIGLGAVSADEGVVLVVMGDTPLLTAGTLRRLAAARAGGDAVTLLTVEADDPTGYGRVIRDDAGAVVAVVEQKDATPEQLAVREINSGIYAFDLGYLRAALGRVGTDNAAGEVYLTSVVALARADGRGVGAVGVADPWESAGVNDRVQLAGLGAELNRRLLVDWMRAGVTVVDPATTWVDVGVELATDVTLLPGVQLHGSTRVGPGATIGPDSTLLDVVVGAGASVVRTHGSGATLAPGTTVGPFAYLRPGTELAERGKIGTFVETKNSRIGPGAKVPHLSYLGDAEVGEATNIGAGTITANYDGVAKHATVVGRHCKTGSHNVFVAPVRIGDGAATGAGAVIRRDVAPGALAVSGGPQRQLDGWVLSRRAGTPAAEAAAAARETPDIGQTGTAAPPSPPDEGTRS